MRSKAGLIISILVSIGCVVWLSRTADWNQIQNSIKEIGWSNWFLATLIYLAAYIPRGVRWKLMLSTCENVPLTETTKVVVIGYAANNLLPFRLGEIVRAYVMALRCSIPKVTCLSSIGAERILDGLVLLLLLFGSLGFVSLTGDVGTGLRLAAILFLAVFLGALLVLILSLRFENQFFHLVHRVSSGKLDMLFSKIISGFYFLKNGKQALGAIFLSLLIWFFEGAMFAYLMNRLHVEHPFPRAFFVLAVVNLGILVPSAPGYIGVFQAGSIAAFVALGLDKSDGLALGLTAHLAQFAPVTLSGLILFPLMNLRWREIARMKTSLPVS